MPRLSLLFLLLNLAVLPTYANSSEYDEHKPIGWGSVESVTTGSEDENQVTVTTFDQLKAEFKGTDKKTIFISGELKVDGQYSFDKVQNKTLYGLPGSALVNDVHSETVSKSGIMMIKNSSNIILRNLTFKGAGAYDIDGNDNLTLQNCQHIWVDHCDFQDGVDGNFDVNNSSDFISVTWCRFRYLIAPWAGGSGGSNAHCFSNLVGGSDSNASKDEGHLNITYANCWWDEGCIERMPRVRFGKVHILNCLYTSSKTNYCVGGGYRSNIYIENSTFVKVKNPWKKYATSGSYTDYNVTLKGNLGVDIKLGKDGIGTEDNQQKSGNISYFIPSDHYTYTAYDASLVQETVSNEKTGAGATLEKNQLNATSITSIRQDISDDDVIYDLMGKRVYNIEKSGIYIRNGRKMIMR